MLFKTLTRTAILKTNPVWPFTRLNRIPYSIALHHFAMHCRKLPYIRAVYLRHPLIDGQWTPALSDLDLTVVTENGLQRELEFELLTSFWKGIRRFKRIYPMIGEIDVICENYLQSWIKFGIEGRNQKNWVLLSGRPIPPKSSSCQTKLFSRDAFDHTFWFYYHHLTLLSEQKNVSPYLQRQDALRIQKKIGRCLTAIGCMESKAIHFNSHPDSAGIQLEILKNLDLGLGCVEGFTAFVEPHDLHSRSMIKLYRNGKTAMPEVEHPSVFIRNEESIFAIYRDHPGQATIILRDAENTADNRLCILEVRQFYANQEVTPRFLTAELFAYLLCYHNPRYYAHYIKRASLEFGEDILVQVKPPDKTAIVHSVLKRTPLLLLLPQSEKFLEPLRPFSSGQQRFDHNLYALLSLKMYLLHHTIKANLSDAIAFHAKKHPRETDMISRITQTPHSQQTRKDRFFFFRDTLDEIHQILSSDSDWESAHLA